MTTTGWPPGMLQDDSRELSRWLANRPGALYQLSRTAMNTEDKLREALEQIANFSDVEMGDGDGARKVALEALAAPAAPSEPVAYWIPESEQFCIATNGERPMARAWRPLYAFSQPSAKPAGAADSEFKNFHRLLCERFGYRFDPVDWKRDQASLIEYIDQLGDAREHLGFEKASDKSDAHFCGYARVRDGKYELAGMRDCPIMRDGELHPIYTGIPDLASTPAPVKSGQPNVEFELRWMLACRISGVALYTDDGELQDNSVHPFIDFKRDTPQQIREALLKRANTAPVMAVAPEAAARDAARYRWLRDKTNWDVLPVDDGDDIAEWRCVFHSPYGMRDEAEDNLDKAIDSAMTSASHAAQCAAGAKPAGVDFGDDSFRRAAPPAAHGAPVKADGLAVWFHETYERLAPQFGYETRTETRVFDPHSSNGKLMIAVCSELVRLIEASKQRLVEFYAGATPPAAQGAGAEVAVMRQGGIPVGFIGERNALAALRDDIDSLPLHAHKRKVVRDWICAAISRVESEASLAAQGAPAMAEAASLETALVTQFGSTTEYDELICAIWAAQPHYFRNREQSLEKARGLLAAATLKGQA